MLAASRKYESVGRWSFAASKGQGWIPFFLPGLSAHPAERLWVPALSCWQDSSLHPLHQRSLLPLKAPLAPARYWGSQDGECVLQVPLPHFCSWAAEWLLAKFLDTGGLYSSGNQYGATDSLCAFRDSALYFLTAVFTHDDLFLPLWKVS